MNKTALKNFAIWARKKLISDITYSAGLLAVNENGIGEPLPQSRSDLQLFDIGTKDYAEVKGERISQRNSLVSAIRAKAEELDNYKVAFEYIVEEVAYTWFNRMIAIRFMEVNGYLPIRVLSSESGKHEPDIVTTPFDAGLEFTGEESGRIYELRDNNRLEELFRMLFIRECNHLHDILPELFEATNDYSELLLSLSYTDKDGVVFHLVNDISEDDFNIEKEGQVEIIGWMYQYYNTEPKDKVFAALKKNVKITKENIPAATQLFTPHWIVRYMVENSLGRLWIEGHPDDDLRQCWEYYLDEAEQEPQVQAQLEEIRAGYREISPEDIRIIDPCMGSGHILVYAFDVLMQIYSAQGYSERDAAKLIVEKNLWGLDIDRRAYQLAYFAVMMKARQYNRRILTSGIKPNLFVIDDNRALTPEIIEYIADGDSKIAADLRSISNDLTNAREYGSIINVQPVDFSGLIERIGVIAQSDELNLIAMENKRIACEKILPLVNQAQALSQKYDVVCTNPPYMGGSGMNNQLSDYVKGNYFEYKSDLFSVSIIKCMNLTKKNGFAGFLSPYVWMFIQSYEQLRKYMYSKCSIETLIQFEYSAFAEATVPICTFVLGNRQISKNGCYFRLTDFRGGMEVQREKTLEAIKNHNCGFYYESNPKNFSKIPGMPVAYWVSEKVYSDFQNTLLGDIAPTKKGLDTGNNDRFLRYWFEINYNKLGIDFSSSIDFTNSTMKWAPHDKGGEYRRWYGNKEWVINWENDGCELRNSKANLRSERFYFHNAITWCSLSSGKISFRYSDYGAISNTAGSSLYPNEKMTNNLLGLLNTKVAQYLLDIVSPTLNYSAGQVSLIPIVLSRNSNENEYVKDNINLSKEDWDSFETSWDFKTHPLIKPVPFISEAFAQWSDECEKRFTQLKSNEEELNRIFIDIYGLQDELAPEVEDKDVTVRKADLGRDIRSFISYAVGCMFGRYSLDVEGLVYAGGEWDNRKYASFAADKDNIIPICDDEYFEDDIVGMFVEFVKTVYGADTLDENLKFIADALGGKGQPKDVIRNYFLSDFYSDHCKIYQKRPIYWLFDSGKKNGFKALIYMHRYQPDTIARIRTDYVHEQQARYRTAIADLEQRIANASTGERVKLNRKLTTLQAQDTEIRTYEEKIHHLADQMISIDLDDGVKKNYAIFQDVLKKI